MKTTIIDIGNEPLFSDGALTIKYSYVESQIELEDSLWQIFSEPTTITLLNVDRLQKITFPYPDATSAMNFWFDLSKEVHKEGR